MKLAYADPPYINQAKRHYSHDPRCAEVDHAELITTLQQYDGWALSMSAARYSLQEIVALMPEGSRMAAWVKPFASFKPGVNPAYTWEPVIFVSARPNRRDVDTVKDHCIESITLKKGLAGAKPIRFCKWIFALIGAEPDDTLCDLYPGTGIVSSTWDEWRRIQRREPSQIPLQFDLQPSA